MKIKSIVLHQTLQDLSEEYFKLYDLQRKTTKRMQEMEDFLNDMYEPLKLLALKVIFKYYIVSNDYKNDIAQLLAHNIASDIIVSMHLNGQPRITKWVGFLKYKIKMFYREKYRVQNLHYNEDNIINQLDSGGDVTKNLGFGKYRTFEPDYIYNRDENLYRVFNNVKESVREKLPYKGRDKKDDLALLSTLLILISTHKDFNFIDLKPKELMNLIQVKKVMFDESVKELIIKE